MALQRAFECLREWAVRLVRHRDMAAKRISEVKEADYGFVVINSDGTSAQCFVQPTLKGNPVFSAAAGKSAIIFTLSNEENIKAVYSAWAGLSENISVLIVFANPFSQMEEKWLLRPHLHNKVCDNSSLLQGLKAMAEFVEPITEEELALKLEQLGNQTEETSQRTPPPR